MRLFFVVGTCVVSLAFSLSSVFADSVRLTQSSQISAQMLALPRGDFSLHGKVGSFRFDSAVTSSQRTIVYYVPNSIANPAQPVDGKLHKVLYFMHGGGGSTSSDASATRVTQQYIQDFIQYAEANQVVLVFPTTSFGWNYHTRFFLRELLPYVQSQIAVDPDRSVLAGHSMGGMGITREYPFLTDLFSGFLALSAGTQPFMHDELYVTPYLNGTPYTHINGDRDHFDAFKPRMLAIQKRVQEIESKFGAKSRFKLLFHPGGHNMDPALSFKELSLLFQEKRVTQPKVFHSFFWNGHVPVQSNGQPRLDATKDQAYYLKLIGIQAAAPEKSYDMRITVEIQGQEIRIQETQNSGLVAQAMEVALTPELIDFDQSIVIRMNGRTVYEGPAQATVRFNL